MKKVQVLMSTYNGENKIKCQVDSIFSQKGVEVCLNIRDDGSDADTIRILKEIKKKYKDKVDINIGNNIGYQKSFLTLLRNIDGSVDYYAFSDQDDFWEKDKLESAIKKLESINDKYKLYLSSLDIFDEQLNFIGKHDVSRIPNNIQSLFTRMRYAGCTFVFSKSLASIAKGSVNLDFPNSEMPDHDQYLAAFAYTYGCVVIDPESHIKHIRYKNSATSGGNGLIKRLKTEYSNIFKRKNTTLIISDILLNSSGSQNIVKNNINYLQIVHSYKENLRSRLILINKLNCGNFICNIEAMLKVMIGTF